MNRKRVFQRLILVLGLAAIANPARSTEVPEAFSPTPSTTFMDLWSVTPREEYRAVWLTTIKGLDWPTFTATTPSGEEAQREELLRILDTLHEVGINTVFFQARLRGSVVYPSVLEPFDAIFTGKEGRAPKTFDPLQLVIDECHRRGMQCHAWIVSLQVKDNRYVDPSLASTRRHLCDMVREVVTNYDVDGIHLDYIRYPERTRGQGDFRRASVTAVVRDVYATVKSIKPWVLVSTAPLGKYRDTARYSSYGWNAWGTVFQEAQEWMREGCIDALFPMLYYRDQHYYPFAVDWAEHSYGRHVGLGLGVYQLDRLEGSNWGIEAIRSQLEYSRQIDAFADAQCAGVASFRAGFICKNTKGLRDEMRYFYRYPAHVPSQSWVTTPPPARPVLHGEVVGDSVRLTWSLPAVQPSTIDDGHRVCNVYWSVGEPVDTDNAMHLQMTRLTTTSLTLPRPSRNVTTYYAVTVTDRYGKESQPARWTDVITPIHPR